jgi:hypothetical protein
MTNKHRIKKFKTVFWILMAFQKHFERFFSYLMLDCRNTDELKKFFFNYFVIQENSTTFVP